MRCFLERPGTIAKECETLKIGQYGPVGAIETLTPKSWLGFRIAHQLTAADNVIYLAALLDCAPNLEAERLPKDDNEAFAYRFAEGESFRIFEPARGYHHGGAPRGERPASWQIATPVALDATVMQLGVTI